MRKYANLSVVLLLIVSLATGGCESEESLGSGEDTVRLTFTFSARRPATVEVGTLHSFTFQDSVMAELKPSADTMALALSFSEPTLAYLAVGEKSYPLYLSPGDDLKVSVSDTGDQSTITYAGVGSEVNGYLTRINQIKEELIQVNGKYVWEVGRNEFTERLDSMKHAYSDFHRSFTDTVALPEAISTSLKNRNRLMLVSQRENYDLVHYSDRSTTAAPNAYYRVPLDTTFLHHSLLKYEYAVALKFHLDLHVGWPLYDSIQETAANSPDLPILMDKAIRSNQYPAGIQEFMLAKNVDDFLSGQGITPATDTILNRFKKEYRASALVAPLEDRYQRWLALAPGRPAPEISGTTPAGQLLSLSDLRGKVVYVDVWATWCGPCLREFPHSQQLQQQFEGNDEVVFLYVSVDRKEDQEKWKNMIADQPLNGTHINSVPEGETSMNEKYMINGIPRYMLIDQAGNIVDAEADRPSSGKVTEELQKLLSDS